jgi:hypothetical protein
LKKWVRNTIDRFVLSRLEREGLEPSPEAGRATLIRRLSFDLTGLPPSPEAVKAFVEDRSRDAYERVVDRLLGSPQFGERWGRHWLDLARYADSDGYEKDGVRPYAYLYRDWVINALNDDMPFDRFTLEQLAGDLLPGAGRAEQTATGFHRQTLTNKEGGVDQEEYRCKAVVDRVSTTGAVWLGLTVGCAECHSHKYDPVSQREFYELYAFFNNASEREVPAPRPAELADYENRKARWEAAREKLGHEIAARAKVDQTAAQLKWEESLQRTPAWWTTPDPVADALNTPASDRTEDQRASLAKYYREDVDPEIVRLKKARAAQAKKEPKFPETKAAVLLEEAKPRETHIHIRGDFLRKGDAVKPGVLSVLHAFKPRGDRPDRVDLANWLMDPANPLTARVTVNRMWRHLFGRGLTPTVDDFGTRGEKPSHPELLDWLATEFRRLGWSRKAMIKTMVTSAAYRQSSEFRTELLERDPGNVLIARQGRFRLEAENVRDACLSVSGLLNPAIGGPSVRPPLPADIAAIGYANSVKWKESEGADRYRRGLYIFFQRTVPYPMLTTFDAPDSNVTCTRREQSNTPLQALTLLNDPVFFECAQALGRKLAADGAGDDRAQIRRGFQICLGRDPTGEERRRLESFLRVQRQLLESNGTNAVAIAGGGPSPDASVNAALAVTLARTLMNLDEFVTRE